jgi:hypothetical protein
MPTTIAFAEPDLTDVVLETRHLLGDGLDEDELREPGRVSFGVRDPVELSASSPGVDPDLVAFLAGHKEDRFIAAGFTCSFRPAEEPITECRLAIRLRRTQPDGPAGDPVVWSVEPEMMHKPIERTVQVTLNAQAKYVLSAGASRETTQKYTVDDCYLISTGKNESVAEWFFRPTATVPKIEGMHDLRLVARFPADIPVTADVLMSAKIQRRVAGLIPYRAILPPQLSKIPLS